jgi:hypothetical protein
MTLRIPREQQLTVSIPQIADWAEAIPAVPVLGFPGEWIPPIPMYANANFSASAALSAIYAARPAYTPQLTASAQLAVQTLVKAFAFPQFSASGKLTALADENGRLTPEIEIEATLSVLAGAWARPQFTASAQLSAATQFQFLRTASYAAAGQLSAAVTAKAKAAPAFSGVGTLSALAKRYLSDSFNRGNNSDVNVGWPLWTKLGDTNSQISNNTYCTTTTAGQRGVVTTPFNTDDGLIEIVIGGNHNPSSQALSLVGKCNADGSQAVVANIFSGSVYIARMTGSFSAPAMTDIGSNTGVSIANGDTLRLTWNGTTYTLTQNGTTICTANSGIITTGASNRRMGLIVRRSGLTNSASVNSVAMRDL